MLHSATTTPDLGLVWRGSVRLALFIGAVPGGLCGVGVAVGVHFVNVRIRRTPLNSGLLSSCTDPSDSAKPKRNPAFKRDLRPKAPLIDSLSFICKIYTQR